ncbi:YceD family protein [Paracoccus pacificus]|uniref:YceD family protein n=1 Tax=Paracoccus pacificus TaxID=1463598 RepID=A0ABW4R2B7_9RHOB
MTAAPRYSHRLRVAHLNPRAPTEIDLKPDAAARRAIAADLDLLDLPELRFTGRITAEGGQAWALTGRLKARVVQPCVVTLDPVTTDLSEDLRRVYSPHAVQPEGDEVEMPDDEIEPLGQFIDVGEVMVEALALALPPWPRAAGADAAEAALGDDPGAGDEERQKPFAGLADLLARKPH